jgi:hypothetical protein
VSELRKIDNPKWWKPELKLSQADVASVEKVSVRIFGKYHDKYSCVMSDGKDVIVSRVTEVIKEALGSPEPLVTWAVNECVSALLGRPRVAGTEELPDKTLREVEFIGTWQRVEQVARKLKDPFFDLARERAKIVPWEEYSYKQLNEWHKWACGARYRTAEEAAELGTRAHELIELWVRTGSLRFIDEWGAEREYDLADERPEVQRAFSAFLDFWRAHQLKVLACECWMGDVELGVGGTLDVVCECPDGSLVITDWKTSNKVRDRYLLQVGGAYSTLWERAGHRPIDRCYIVRLDKQTADLQVVPVFVDAEGRQRHQRGWAGLVETFRYLREAKKYLKPFGKETDDDE